MRVLYTHSGNLRSPRANLIQVARMCQAFADSPADVTLFYPRYLLGNTLALDEVRSFYSLKNNVKIRPLTTFLTPWLDRTPLVPISKTLGYFFELPRLFARDKVGSNDVIYSRCYLAAGFFSTIRQLLPRTRRPILLFEAHDLPTGVRANVLKGTDGVVAITEALKQDLVTKLGIDHEKILVAPDGVPESWTQKYTSRREARGELGLDLEPPHVIYTGSLGREVYADTLEILVEIARALEGEAQVIQVGTPPILKHRPNRLPRNLHFLGLHPLESIRIFQAAADVLVVPYSSKKRYVKYMSPLKLFEYMAAGRPIVAFDLSVLREVLTDEVNAILIRPDDPLAMADGIRLVLADGELGLSIANEARQQAKAYTWEKRAKMIIKFANERQKSAKANPSRDLHRKSRAPE